MIRPRLTNGYPFLFAVIPILRLVAAYPGWAEPGDVALILAAVLTACALVYVLAWLVARRRARRLPPLLLFGVILAFWGYARAATILGRRTGVPHAVLAPVWAGVTIGLVWWLLRRPGRLDRAETFLTLTGVMLVAWLVVSIGLGQWRSAAALRQSPLVRRLAQPVSTRANPRVESQRDIYLIVLDEYANAEVTGRLFGFDNHVFLDSLRRLGFVVPVVHSNYLHTFLSLPSMLNSAHVAGLAEELGRRSLDRTLPDHLVKHNRTVRFLKSRGYRFAFFPSLAWEATRHSPLADFETHVSWEGSPGYIVSRSGLRQVLVKTSLLKYIDWESDALDRGHVTRTMAAIAQVPKLPGPVFAFAHVLSPHGPYVFDGSCGAVSRRSDTTHTASLGSAYVAQIQCLDRLVLQLVTTVLRTSDPAPVILLQGDHGSKMLGFDKAPAAEAISLSAAKERLGAFGAYYLPDHGREAFGDSVTVVNVMGNVLRYYLGADLPRAADDMYISVDATPYAFKRVDFPWLAREDWSAPATQSSVDARRKGALSPPPARDSL